MSLSKNAMVWWFILNGAMSVMRIPMLAVVISAMIQLAGSLFLAIKPFRSLRLVGLNLDPFYLDLSIDLEASQGFV